MGAIGKVGSTPQTGATSLVDEAIQDLEQVVPALKGTLESLRDGFDAAVSTTRGAFDTQFGSTPAPTTPPPSVPSAPTSPAPVASPVATPTSSGSSATSGAGAVSAPALPVSSSAFVNAIAPGAVAAEEKYGVPASVTLAQAILESGMGQSGLSKQAHNLFGIKGTGPAGSVTLPTQEYLSGKWVTVNAPFRAYANDAQSIDDHAKLLATSSYYTKAMADRGNPNQFAQDLTGVYATDPNYGSKLQSIMKEYNLYAYDQPVASGGTTPSAPTSAPTTASTGGNPTLYEGSTGAAVAQLQQQLTKLGFATQGADGQFGPHTQQALMTFQKAHGLAEDGVCGPATWAALAEAASSVSA